MFTYIQYLSTICDNTVVCAYIVSSYIHECMYTIVIFIGTDYIMYIYIYVENTYI